MTLKEILKSHYSSCLCSHCSNKGVSVSLDKISKDHIVMNGEKYKSLYRYTSNLCDFFVFDNVSSNPIRVAVMDMKGGTLDENKFKIAFNQLTNGALIVDAIVSTIDVDQFIPRLVVEKGINPFASRMMASDKYKITFRTFSKYIKTIHKGQSLIF